MTNNYTIEIEPSLTETPARIYRAHKLILLGSNFFRYKPAYQRLILLHELGHGELDTSNEVAADEFAFKHFANSEPQSLKNSIRVMLDVLDIQNPSHVNRLNHAFFRAAWFDYFINSNPKSLQSMKRIISNIPGKAHTPEMRLIAQIKNLKPQQAREIILPLKAILSKAVQDQSFQENELNTLNAKLQELNTEFQNFKDAMPENMNEITPPPTADDLQNPQQIKSTASGFVWGFGTTFLLVVIAIAGFIYLTKKF